MTNLKPFCTLQFLILATLLLLLLQACAINPMGAAETLEQRAFALYGTFVVFEELAADVVEDPATSESTRQRIRELDARLKPAADAMIEASLEVGRIRAELAGAERDERLAIAAANLERWVDEVVPLVREFMAAVRG